MMDHKKFKKVDSFIFEEINQNKINNESSRWFRKFNEVTFTVKNISLSTHFQLNEIDIRSAVSLDIYENDEIYSEIKPKKNTHKHLKGSSEDFSDKLHHMVDDGNSEYSAFEINQPVEIEIINCEDNILINENYPNGVYHGDFYHDDEDNCFTLTVWMTRDYFDEIEKSLKSDLLVELEITVALLSYREEICYKLRNRSLKRYIFIEKDHTLSPATTINLTSRQKNSEKDGVTKRSLYETINDALMLNTKTKLLIFVFFAAILIFMK